MSISRRKLFGLIAAAPVAPVVATKALQAAPTPPDTGACMDEIIRWIGAGDSPWDIAFRRDCVESALEATLRDKPKFDISPRARP